MQTDIRHVVAVNPDRRQFMRKSKILTAIIVFVAVSVLIVSAMLEKTRDASYKPQDSSKAPTAVLDENELEAELVNLDEWKGTLKIDLITPGMDTHYLKVVLFDLESHSIISKTEIGEGTWLTGLTDEGFYVIDQTNKALKLYDMEGNNLSTKNFVSDDAWSSACGLSRDGKQLVYTTLKDGNAYVVSVEEDKTKLIDSGVFCTEFIGAENGNYYLRSVNGELLLLSENEVRILVTDKRLTRLGSKLCAGNAEYGIAVTYTDPVIIKYLPVASVDETLIGIGDNYIATCISKEKSDLIKSYDLVNNTYTKVEIADRVKDIVYTNDGEFIAVTGEGSSNEIYACSTEGKETKSFALSLSDKPINSSERFETQAANTAYCDKLIKNVPLIHQFPEFPTGCESVSAVMALKYFGENISVTNFINDHLPQSRNFYYVNSKKYGPDPKEYFIGNPKTAASFGCMASVIERALNNYFGAKGRVANTTGTKLSTLCSVYIDNDVPVLVWATIGMLETNPQNTWYLENGTRFTWPGNEHCLLLVGYDKDNYYFNDPYSGKCVSYEKNLCEDRYAELGYQSVVILPE